MPLIQINKLTFQYEDSDDMIFDHVWFSFDTNYRTGLIGRNGRGKTTLLKLLKNEFDYQEDIKIQERCEYFPYSIANPQKWTVHICQDIDPTLQLWQLEKELNELNVCLDVLYRPFDTLSKGEQTKVLLAILFLKPHVFLLIDEPTNHLDQISRVVIAKYLKKQKGFLLVSHDRAFIDECCNHIIAINSTSIDVVNGNFSSWYENKLNQDQFNIQKNQKLKKDIKKLEISKQRTQSWANSIENKKMDYVFQGSKLTRVI